MCTWLPVEFESWIDCIGQWGIVRYCEPGRTALQHHTLVNAVTRKYQETEPALPAGVLWIACAYSRSQVHNVKMWPNKREITALYIICILDYWCVNNRPMRQFPTFARFHTTTIFCSRLQQLDVSPVRVCALLPECFETDVCDLVHWMPQARGREMSSSLTIRPLSL